jgi:hypothetical protein
MRIFCLSAVVLGASIVSFQANAEMPDRAELEAALDECASSLGVDDNGRPDVSAMDSCMSAKGYSRPSGPPGHGEAGGHGHPPPVRGE